MSNETDPSCIIHKNFYITNYCFSAECLKELCPECIESHYKFHKQNDTQPMITSLRSAKNKTIDKIKTIIIAINQEMEKCSLDYLLNPNDILQQGVLNIQNFRDRLISQIKSYCDSLEKDLQKRIDIQMLQITDFSKIFEHMKGIIRDLEYMKEKLENSSRIDSLRKISMLDIRHLIEKFRTEINSLLETKTIKPINIIIDENRLLNNFDRELKKLIMINNENKKIDESIDIFTPQKEGIQVSFIQNTNQIHQKRTFHASSKFNITLPNYFDSDTQPYLHFFQTGSKFLHLFKFIKNKITNPEVIELNFNLNIPSFHKSIAIPNGDLYLIGGSYGKDESEKKNQFIYKYNFKNHSLSIEGELLYPRSSHSICYNNGFIYIIGGLIKGQKVTNKCERFNLETKEIEEINSMNYSVANSSVCNFFTDYLFRFGGISIEKTSETILSQTIEKYDIIKNKWFNLKINVSQIYDSHTKSKKANYFNLLSMAGSCQINKSEILVFGGYEENNIGISQTFIFNVDYSNMENNDNCIISGINLIKLPVSDGFWNNCPVIFEKKIFCLQNISNSSQIQECIEDQRRILIFNQFSWDVFEFEF